MSEQKGQEKKFLAFDRINFPVYTGMQRLCFGGGAGPIMTIRGEVSYKVKRAILILRQFTIGQIADVTELDHQGVETVVHRLVREGLLVRTEETVRNPSQRGRPRQLYALAEDPAQVQKLRVSVEAFQFREEPLLISQRRPESAHYLQVVSKLDTLDAMEMKQGSLESSPDALEEIEQQLAFARRYEAMLEDGVEVATAYLDFEQARLEFLQENTAEGERLLSQARSVFQDFGMGDKVRLLNEYAVAIMLRQQLATVMPSALRAPGAPSEQLKEAIEPLSRLAVPPILSSVILQLAETADAAIKANAELTQENKRLQIQVNSLVQQDARLMLEYQSSATLDKMLRRTQRRPTPSYPRQGFPVPVLKENQDDLIMRDFMGKALAQEFWPEADAEQQRRQSVRRFRLRTH